MHKQSIVSAVLYVLVIGVVVAVPAYYWYEIQHPSSQKIHPKPAAKSSWKDGYNIYLTAKEVNGVPMNQPSTTFSCGDKIYGIVEIERPNDDKSHVLHAFWRNPRGEDQERIDYPFKLVAGNARLWVWLKLHRSAEAAAVKFLNPSAGLEEFIGEWEIVVDVDDKQVARKKFEVIC